MAHHGTFERNEGESTQWEDIQVRKPACPSPAQQLCSPALQGPPTGRHRPPACAFLLCVQRKLGNLPEKEAVWKPEAYKPEEEEKKDAKWLEGKEADELEELEDDFADDRFLEEYRCDEEEVEFDVCARRLRSTLFEGGEVRAGSCICVHGCVRNAGEVLEGRGGVAGEKERLG